MGMGKRWSKIAKELGNSRTEHMVKNRFKTIYSRQKKLYPSLKSEDLLIKSFIDPPSTTPETPMKDEDQT